MAWSPFRRRRKAHLRRRSHPDALQTVRFLRRLGHSVVALKWTPRQGRFEPAPVAAMPFRDIQLPRPRPGLTNPSIKVLSNRYPPRLAIRTVSDTSFLI